MKIYKRRFKEYEDYVGSHQAPTNDGYNAPLYDLSNFYPDDIYSNKAVQYYGVGESYDKQAIKVMQMNRDKPNGIVTAYRAVPKGVKPKLNKGDWVSITKEYAIEHGENWLDGDFDLITQKVKASQLYTDGNSIHEWGYDK